MGEVVAPCLECSATIVIFTVNKGKVVDRLEFPISSREPLDRIRLLRDQKVDTIICGGVQEAYEDMVIASGVRMVSWVSGSVEELLALYMSGRLESGKRAGSGSRRSRSGDEPDHAN